MNLYLNGEKNPVRLISISGGYFSITNHDVIFVSGISHDRFSPDLNLVAQLNCLCVCEYGTASVTWVKRRHCHMLLRRTVIGINITQLIGGSTSVVFFFSSVVVYIPDDDTCDAVGHLQIWKSRLIDKSIHVIIFTDTAFVYQVIKNIQSL